MRTKLTRNNYKDRDYAVELVCRNLADKINEIRTEFSDSRYKDRPLIAPQITAMKSERIVEIIQALKVVIDAYVFCSENKRERMQNELKKAGSSVEHERNAFDVIFNIANYFYIDEYNKYQFYTGLMLDDTGATRIDDHLTKIVDEGIAEFYKKGQGFSPATVVKIAYKLADKHSCNTPAEVKIYQRLEEYAEAARKGSNHWAGVEY